MKWWKSPAVQLAFALGGGYLAYRWLVRGSVARPGQAPRQEIVMNKNKYGRDDVDRVQPQTDAPPMFLTSGQASSAAPGSTPAAVPGAVPGAGGGVATPTATSTSFFPTRSASVTPVVPTSTLVQTAGGAPAVSTTSKLLSTKLATTQVQSLRGWGR